MAHIMEKHHYIPHSTCACTVQVLATLHVLTTLQISPQLIFVSDASKRVGILLFQVAYPPQRTQKGLI